MLSEGREHFRTGVPHMALHDPHCFDTAIGIAFGIRTDAGIRIGGLDPVERHEMGLRALSRARSLVALPSLRWLGAGASARVVIGIGVGPVRWVYGSE
jgi:hypothetical protein